MVSRSIQPSTSRVVDGIAFRSPMEATFWRAWRRRYPAIALHPQVRIKGAKGWPRVDFLALDAKIILEIDGLIWHNSPNARRDDAARDAELARVGYRVVRFTGREIARDVGRCVETAYRAIAS